MEPQQNEISEKPGSKTAQALPARIENLHLPTATKLTSFEVKPKSNTSYSCNLASCQDGYPLRLDIYSNSKGKFAQCFQIQIPPETKLDFLVPEKLQELAPDKRLREIYYGIDAFNKTSSLKIEVQPSHAETSEIAVNQDERLGVGTLLKSRRGFITFHEFFGGIERAEYELTKFYRDKPVARMSVGLTNLSPGLATREVSLTFSFSGKDLDADCKASQNFYFSFQLQSRSLKNHFHSDTDLIISTFTSCNPRTTVELLSDLKATESGMQSPSSSLLSDKQVKKIEHPQKPLAPYSLKHNSAATAYGSWIFRTDNEQRPLLIAVENSSVATRIEFHRTKLLSKIYFNNSFQLEDIFERLKDPTKTVALNAVKHLLELPVSPKIQHNLYDSKIKNIFLNEFSDIPQLANPVTFHSGMQVKSHKNWEVFEIFKGREVFTISKAPDNSLIFDSLTFSADQNGHGRILLANKRGFSIECTLPKFGNQPSSMFQNISRIKTVMTAFINSKTAVFEELPYIAESVICTGPIDFSSRSVAAMRNLSRFIAVGQKVFQDQFVECINRIIEKKSTARDGSPVFDLKLGLNNKLSLNFEISANGVSRVKVFESMMWLPKFMTVPKTYEFRQAEPLSQERFVNMVTELLLLAEQAKHEASFAASGLKAFLERSTQ